MATSMAAELLRRQLQEMSRNPPEGVSVGLGEDDNIFEWEVLIVGPGDTLYEGGFFKAALSFPPDFPSSPPTMRFTTPVFHPNVYPSEGSADGHAPGEVCISILHPAGVDEMNEQETAEERWRPVLGVEAILLSVISMLSDPNDESPANLDAAVMWRDDPDSFKREVRRCVRRSQEEL